jgi:CRISPR system Cascade subunit CasB
MSNRDENFINYLGKLRDDRAAMAALRRGLGQYPGSEPKMYRYVASFVEKAPAKTEYLYYLIASLYAFHPQEGGSGNMGDHFWAVDPKAENDAIVRRFENLLTARFDDLHLHMRGVVSYLKSKEVPINWFRLLSDLQGWQNRKRTVQHRWAKRFYRDSS